MVWALRMSYAGEAGWELHALRESIPAVYDALTSECEAFGIADYGSFAMNVMRMEKAFPGAGELTNEVTLPEANVMRFVKTDKPEFIGRAATLESEAADLPWVCVYLEIEPDGDCDGHGGETVLLNGEPVGSTTSVVFGHTVGKILAFAYLHPKAAEPGTELEVLVLGQPRPSVVAGQAAYDPANERPRAGANTAIARTGS